jgi:hypothetical protein
MAVFAESIDGSEKTGVFAILTRRILDSAEIALLASAAATHKTQPAAAAKKGGKLFKNELFTMKPFPSGVKGYCILP